MVCISNAIELFRVESGALNIQGQLSIDEVSVNKSYASVQSCFSSQTVSDTGHCQSQTPWYTLSTTSILPQSLIFLLLPPNIPLMWLLLNLCFSFALLISSIRGVSIFGWVVSCQVLWTSSGALCYFCLFSLLIYRRNFLFEILLFIAPWTFFSFRFTIVFSPSTLPVFCKVWWTKRTWFLRSDNLAQESVFFI